METVPDSPLGRLAPRRIAVLRALMLGDLLCAIPALRAVRFSFPKAELTLVGLGWARGFAERFRHLCDDFLELPGFPGLPESEPRVAELPAFLAAAHARRFDLAVQLHGDGRVTNTLAALLGARRTAGFHPRGEPTPDRELFIPWPAHGHEIHRLLALPLALGLEPRGDGLELPLRPADGEELRAVAPGLEPGTYAVVHPGARSAAPWPPEAFAAVAARLAARRLEIVLTGSPAEARATARVRAALGRPALDLAGRTSLGALGALVAGARVAVTNDTGVSHVAAALRTPSVVVVTSSDPERWAPLDRRRHRVCVRPSDPGIVSRAAEALLADVAAAA